MRRLLLIFLLTGAFAAGAHDYYLLPDKFFLKKGDLFVCRLFVGDDFTEELEERPIHKYIITRFDWIGNIVGSPSDVKAYDLLGRARDSTMPVVKQPASRSGLNLLRMDRSYARIAFTHEKFIAYLKAEHLDGVRSAAILQPPPDTAYRIREKYTRYIKTLFAVGKPTGDVYKDRLGQTLEIILLQNPYAVKRGGRVAAQVFFRGKPLRDGAAEALCRKADGSVVKELIKTDDEGKLSFTLSQAGDWMVRITHMIPAAQPDADWESFWASYTFGVQ